MTRSDPQPHCLAPLARGKEVVLILGSFPGRLSLEKKQYYAHPRNSFWPIMADLFGFDPRLSYQRRVALLTQHKVAVWDVLGSCARKGSLDSSIKESTMVINDFGTFFENNPGIRTICFNGALAERQFVKNVLVKPQIHVRLMSLHRLPSTSPAMAVLNFEQKREVWKVVAAAANST
jgi:hypoxanthine-DNA glycosylase